MPLSTNLRVFIYKVGQVGTSLRRSALGVTYQKMLPLLMPMVKYSMVNVEIIQIDLVIYVCRPGRRKMIKSHFVCVYSK